MRKCCSTAKPTQSQTAKLDRRCARQTAGWVSVCPLCRLEHRLIRSHHSALRCERARAREGERGARRSPPPTLASHPPGLPFQSLNLLTLHQDLLHRIRFVIEAKSSSSSSAAAPAAAALSVHIPACDLERSDEHSRCMPVKVRKHQHQIVTTIIKIR